MNKTDIARRVTRGLAVLILCVGLQYYATQRFDLPRQLLDFADHPLMAWLSVAILLAGVAAVILPLRTPGRRRPLWWGGGSLLALAALILVAPVTFVIDSFGSGDFESILIALGNSQPGNIIADVLFGDLSSQMFSAVTVALGVTLSSLWLWRSLPGFPPVLAGISVVAIATSTPAEYVYAHIWPDPARNLIAVADLRPPVITASPAVLPNLVLIYLESLERSFRDIPATADAFAPLAAIEDAGFSAREVGQIHGTHFSAAGLVATQCGVPLVSRGVVNPQKARSRTAIKRFDLPDFMAGITCLGDVLAERGYSGSYINGSDVALYLIGDFMRNHGYDRVRGLMADEKFINRPDRNSWGVPDTILFQEAGSELNRLAGERQPFFLSLLTVSIHSPDGFPSPGCDYVSPVLPSRTDSQIPAAIHCTAELVQSFLDLIERTATDRPTIIAIMSDHLAMKNTLEAELKAVNDERRNLFIILNGPEMGTVNTETATPLDIYPTLLEAMGFTLADGAANLGRSLLTGRETLAGKLGPEMLDRALRANGDVRRRIWETPPEDIRQARE